MKATLSTIILCFSFSSLAATGTINADRTLDPMVNVTISGKAAEVIFRNLSSRGDMHPGSITKAGKDVTCTAFSNRGKSMFECTMSIDQHGQVRGHLVR